jgi:mRNA-degrading endonuclease RelE of RelBE toxin-antitoxin system
MTSAFEVRTTAHFDRDFRTLLRRHRELVGRYAQVVDILQTDPYNRTFSHPVKKLTDVKPGVGQYRIRAGRFRFRYDIEGNVVYLKTCSLRREETYR